MTGQETYHLQCHMIDTVHRGMTEVTGVATEAEEDLHHTEAGDVEEEVSHILL